MSEGGAKAPPSYAPTRFRQSYSYSTEARDLRTKLQGLRAKAQELRTKAQDLRAKAKAQDLRTKTLSKLI